MLKALRSAIFANTSCLKNVCTFKTFQVLYEKNSKITKYGGRYTITMISGHGVGPELMRHVRHIFYFTEVPVDFEHIHVVSNADIKRAVYAAHRNGAAINSNIEQGQGYYSDGYANIEFRRSLDIYLNVVHCHSMPGIKSRFKDIDVILFRQNTEGEYSMKEHENVKGVIESLKIMTQKNTKRFAERAFKYAIKLKRKKMTIIHKANIMKLSDGLFIKTIHETGKRFPSIKLENMIVDNCCMQMVKNPHQFDTMIFPNLYGSIICNTLCGMLGSLAVFNACNYGRNCAVFEPAIRSLGRDIAGRNIANPTAMLKAACEMLRYINLENDAKVIEKAIFETISKDKIHTPDLGGKNTTTDVIKRIKEHIVKIKD